MLPQVTLTGNVVADPELRFTPGGHAVAKFRVAASERRLNKDTNEWEDGDSCFLTVEMWRQLAQNVADTIRKGTNVTVIGKLRQREYEKDGEKRTVYEVKDPEVSVNLARQTATVAKTESGYTGNDNGGFSGAPAAATQPAAGGWGAPAAPAAPAAPLGNDVFGSPF